MFAFKKIVTAFTLPPGLVIFLLMAVGIGIIWKRKPPERPFSGLKS